MILLYKEVILDTYISELESITKKYKSEYSNQPLDVLFAAQIKYKGAVLFYIPRDGVSDEIDKFKVIGTAEIPANVFLKSIEPNFLIVECKTSTEYRICEDQWRIKL